MGVCFLWVIAAFRSRDIEALGIGEVTSFGGVLSDHGEGEALLGLVGLVKLADQQVPPGLYSWQAPPAILSFTTSWLDDICLLHKTLPNVFHPSRSHFICSALLASLPVVPSSLVWSSQCYFPNNSTLFVPHVFPPGTNLRTHLLCAP